jgi:class 3 adenylate cyclase
MVLVMVIFSVFPQPIAPFSMAWTIDNPIGLFPASLLDTPLFVGWTLGLVVVTVAGVASLVIRFRRATPVERQQIKWLVFAVALFAAVYILATVTESWTAVGWLDFFLAVGLINIGATIALSVLRYHLFDIDRIISRTVAYAIVVATLTIAYLAVVLGVGALVAAVSPTDVDWPIPVVATALVAVGFQPVRVRALRVANRLVFGKRRTPYEALAGIEDVELDVLLPRIAQLVTESTAARGAVVWLSAGTDLEPAGVFPDDTRIPPPVNLVDGQIPSTPNLGEMFPMHYQGRLIGALMAVLGPGEELPANDGQLLRDLASRAATTINGVLEATPLPDGIVTFLMTDIEGSTRLWEDDPERMAVALRKHDELVQRLIRDRGGVLVKWKGEGDSTFSVFTDPGSGIEAAVALQEAIKSYQWDLTRPISIRAALHTGEAELRERDYYGQTVNRCARLRSLVRGGQTLVSAATRELVRSARSTSVAFRDLGELPLKDFNEPEHVYEVITQAGDGHTEPKQAISL